MSIYKLKNGIWDDYVERQDGIKTLIGDKWVDGAENPNAPSIAVAIYNNGKWIRKYPSAHIAYTDTYKANNMKYVHNQTSTWESGGTASLKIGPSAIGGIWTTAIYTGWTGLRATTVTAGKGNVDQILSVNCKYARRGVGNWEIGYPIPLVLSTLTSASGSGTTAHNSKRMNTFYSDTNMVLCSTTNEKVEGTTTFNNSNATNVLKEWMNGNYSLLLGYKESKNTPYVALYDIQLEITYTSKLNRAIFVDVPYAYNLSRNKSGDVEMWIFDNEVDMTLDEILERRASNNIRMINDEDVIIEGA